MCRVSKCRFYFVVKSPYMSETQTGEGGEGDHTGNESDFPPALLTKYKLGPLWHIISLAA